MATSNEVTIPIFDGKDYSMWKKRIMLYLKFKKCEDVATRSKMESDTEEWDSRDLKAMNIIYSAISNKQLEYVHEKETTYEIIRKFNDMYLKESTALQIVQRNKLENLKLKDYEDATTFFGDFERAVNDLKNAGAKISETEKLNYMLNTLPESYNHIGDLIDAIKEEERTVEYVKTKILMAEIKFNKVESSCQKSNVFVVRLSGKFKSNQVCHNCGQRGHF